MTNTPLIDRVKKMIKLAIHSGDKYQCPFCGYNSKDFYLIGYDLPVLKEKQIVGAGLRSAGCYKCSSSDRERLIYVYLRDVLKVFENKNLSILHMAPEVNLSALLYKVGYAKYVCGDLFTEGYSYPEYVQNMNVLNIPFEDNSFDLVICNHMLEHVPADRDAMKELYRVLKPGGRAILQVPISKNTKETFEDFSISTPREKEAAFGQFDHVRIYGQDYADRLSSVGFKMERINISSKYEKYGLCKEEDIYTGVK